MTRQRRGITVMIHRDGALDSRTFRVPMWLVRLVVVGGTTLAGLMILAAILYGPIFALAARVPFLNRRIDQLSQENRQVQQLAQSLREAETRYAQVRTMLGGDVVATTPRSTTPLPSAHPILARVPRSTHRYESGPSIPRHWPLEEAGVVTRGQMIGGTGPDETHPGVDIAVPSGTPIRASGGGHVSQAGSDPEYGLYVLIDHPDGYQTLYGHASRVLVETGDEVAAGQVVALAGSTGNSTAPHLHFEIRRDGRSLDPRSLVNEEH
jgi:murein DD-endopeptidase MepM/ murein hydrolase activator NlpD